MKKIIALILILVLAGLIAFAESNKNAPEEITADVEEIIEPEENIYEISGIITEITEEGILMDSADAGMVLVKSDEETVVDASAEIAPGDYITVIYDGMMSRSIPAQITADLIRMYVITGKIISADPEVCGVLLETETHGEVYATLPEPWLENTAETLKIYFGGQMTASLPPRISADHVISLG